MSGAINHKFVSAKVDGGDATLVRPSNWNATLNVSGTDGAVMGVDASQADGWQAIPFTGLMMPAAYNVVAGSEPVGWLLCDGRPVSRTTFARLFAVVGTTWGAGDSSTTFNLPDMRFKAPIGAGSNAALTPTGTTSSGQPTLTAMSSTAGIAVGDIVTGTNIATITVTGNSFNTFAIISGVSSLTGITVGSLVTGTGIPGGTFVTSIDPNSTLGNLIGLSQAATANGTGVTFTISNTTVTLVQNATTVTMSANASGSGSGIVLTFTKPLNTTRTVGQVGGEEKHGLVTNEAPLLQHGHTDAGHTHVHSHTHTEQGISNDSSGGAVGLVAVNNSSGVVVTNQTSSDASPNTSSSATAAVQVTNLGGNLVHNNMQPFGVCAWVIKT